ncbi:MAG: 16S rRNA (guanine(527)-N(7))-methyltransferase RsmG [Bacteroidetes bacterium]|nr:MAG: 16S rRNA (guanine(527)-N(7))-methyltransferase RsmG [Bacteroidota bacterium]
MQIIQKYFPDLLSEQQNRFEKLKPLYEEWNRKINVISRKDMDNFYINHVLHSLSIAKLIDFRPGTQILDVGTGGGFPGIPLAIIFPKSDFILVDSIGKKIKVVNEIASAIDLKNIVALHERAENLTESFDFVVSRAVTALPGFLAWVENKIKPNGNNALQNGILYLKGGDFNEELNQIPQKTKVYKISRFFEEDYFETKKIVHIYPEK